MRPSVVRNLDQAYLADRLARHSEAFGVGADMWFQKRTYRLMAQVAGTQVSGDSVAMLGFQRSSARYFQRPDRGNGSNGFLSDAYDSSLTLMRGVGGYARFSRESGNWLWEVSTNFRTPGFDNNDMTFFSRADYWYMGGNVFRQWTKPTKWYRQLFFILGGQQQYNFDGDLTDQQGQIYGQIQPLNYWNISAFWIRRPGTFDDRLTRGGPVVRRPSTGFWEFNVSTDSRKSVVLGTSVDIGCTSEHFCSRSASLSVRVKPAPNIQLTVGPSWGHDESSTQFIMSATDTFATNFYNRRIVFAELVQGSLGMDTRFNMTFSPNLTLELFVQPLIISGDFSRYKEFAAARGLRKLVYGVDVGTVTPVAAGDSIDPDGGGPAPGFVIAPRDFTFRSLRGNAVLRWEYRPGSTLFLVWTRQGDSSVGRGRIAFGDDFGALFEGPSQNVFLIKANYWLGF